MPVLTPIRLHILCFPDEMRTLAGHAGGYSERARGTRRAGYKMEDFKMPPATALKDLGSRVPAISIETPAVSVETARIHDDPRCMFRDVSMIGLDPDMVVFIVKQTEWLCCEAARVASS